MEPLEIHVQTLVRHWNPRLQQLLQPAIPAGPSGCISHYKYTREALRLHTTKVINLLCVSSNYVSVTKIQYSDTLNISLPSVPSSSDLSLTPLLSQQPNSVVGIMIGYYLEGPWFKSWEEQEMFLYSNTHRLPLGSTQPPVQWVVAGSFSWGLVAGAWSSPSTST
jgi:hypothetical protein